MNSTTIIITYHSDLPEDKNVHFSVTDASGYSLLHDYTMEEISQLDDERLHGVISGLITLKSLFEEAIRLRDERQIKLAQEMEQLLGEKVVVKNIPIDTPSRKVSRYEDDQLCQ
jgi:hypothetical protein